MRDLIREEFIVSSISTKEITRHLYTRVFCGQVIIVHERPSLFLAVIRKEWLRLARKVQRERASTLNTLRTSELTSIISKMQALRYTTKWPPDLELADVYIATIEQLLQWAPEARTLYVVCPIAIEQLHLITAWMPKGGLIVVYKLSSKGVDRHEG